MIPVKETFNRLKSDFSKKHILVIGDLILDSYIIGNSTRLSPEAPVPIVETKEIKSSPGGAANVALNLAGLKAKVTLIGTIGKDSDGEIIKSKLLIHNLISTRFLELSDRSTTIKTRIISGGNHVARFDKENTQNLMLSDQGKLKQIIRESLHNVDALIFQDYDKGLLSENLINSTLKICQTKQIPVYVDPKRKNFEFYKRVKLLKPNLSEFLDFCSVTDFKIEDGFTLKNKLKADILLLTLGKNGMGIFEQESYSKIKTQARLVHDVCGAGDTVISVFTLSNICGCSLEESALISNLAAGRVCEEVGVYPINISALEDIVEHYSRT